MLTRPAAAAASSSSRAHTHTPQDEFRRVNVGGAPTRAPWLVVAIEAHPLITPFLEDVVAFRNGYMAAPPALPFPPSGSSKDLAKFAAASGCPEPTPLRFDKQQRPTHWDFNATSACMHAAFRGATQRLALRPDLNSTGLVHERLAAATAAAGACGALGYDRFVAVPAAVGVADGWLRLPHYRSIGSLLNGGVNFQAAMAASTDGGGGAAPGDGGDADGDNGGDASVPIFDFPAWLQRSFKPSDLVVLKVDIEGAPGWGLGLKETGGCAVPDGGGGARVRRRHGPPPRLPNPHFVPPSIRHPLNARANGPSFQTLHSKFKSSIQKPNRDPLSPAGAEFDLIERLHASGSLCALVDVILWECHKGRGDCVAANERLASCPNLKVLVEGPGGDYVDAPRPPNKRSHIYMG
jgi:hypothetical protein